MSQTKPTSSRRTRDTKGTTKPAPMRQTKPTSPHKTSDTKGKPMQKKPATAPPPPPSPKTPFVSYILCCFGLNQPEYDESGHPIGNTPLCPCDKPKRIATPCSRTHWWHCSNLVRRCWAHWISFKHRHWAREPEFEPVLERARPSGNQRAADDEDLLMSGALQVGPSSGNLPARGNGGKTARLARSVPKIGRVFHRTRSHNTI